MASKHDAIVESEDEDRMLDRKDTTMLECELHRFQVSKRAGAVARQEMERD